MDIVTVAEDGVVTSKEEWLRHMGFSRGQQGEIIEMPGGKLRIRSPSPSTEKIGKFAKNE